MFAGYKPGTTDRICRTDEKSWRHWTCEHKLRCRVISPGNWIIDVGANVGHYSKAASDLAGLSGRVIAFEPVPETFSILSANMKWLNAKNVTLINAAASDHSQLVKMVIPFASNGLKTLQMSHIESNSVEDGFEVLAINIDSLRIPHKVSLVKIDAEGHEIDILTGMLELLQRDFPILIIETGTPQVSELLTSVGYTGVQIKGSPNVIYSHITN